MGRKYTSYYVMSKEQYQEMEHFYIRLGYSDKQVKKLCSNCFGAPVRIDDNIAYETDWRFSRQIDWHRERPVECGMPAPGAGAGAMAMMGMPGPMMSSPMMAQAAMPAPLPMAMTEPEEAPGFNTATTENAPENEEKSPLDSSQAIFSANVNTASWGYLRNRISTHREVIPEFVRIEEIINSYRYDLKAPDNGELFSVSAENGPCPWNDGAELLFLGFKGMKADTNVPQNLVFLVDVSGSMDDQWILVQMSISAIMSKLKKGDTLSIIAYSDKTSTVAKMIDCGNRDKLVNAVMDIEGIGGCTYGSEGLEQAYEYLSKHFDEKGNNRVFIFTDGDFNFGVTTKGGLERLIYDKRQTGIYLSIVGYGLQNIKDDKMETLAKNGNGNYTFVSNPYDILDNLWDKLISNLVTVAKDVKISVEPNPAYVSRYRLIGYDARMLTQKEFHDTEKAADGIGSEHNVVALIEWQRGRAEQEYKGRYVNTAVTDAGDELAFIEVHYKTPEGENKVMTHAVTLGDIAEGGANVSTAAILAAFGLLVRKSEYKGSMTKQALSELTESYLERTGAERPARYTHFDIIRQYAK